MQSPNWSDPIPLKEMQAWQVNQRVSKTSQDDADLITPS
jgi:hypothetical protein